MPMMSCDKAKQLLADYLDNAIEPGIRKEIDAYLETDAGCKKIFVDALYIQNKIANLQSVTPSKEFDVKLRNEVIKFNNGEIKEPAIGKKSISIVFSGALLVTALYFYVFTDVGLQPNANEGIMPSSTISSSPNYNTEPEKLNVQTAEKKTDETATDSLKNLPEKVDNSKIHLTGKRD